MGRILNRLFNETRITTHWKNCWIDLSNTSILSLSNAQYAFGSMPKETVHHHLLSKLEEQVENKVSQLATPGFSPKQHWLYKKHHGRLFPDGTPQRDIEERLVSKWLPRGCGNFSTERTPPDSRFKGVELKNVLTKIYLDTKLHYRRHIKRHLGKHCASLII